MNTVLVFANPIAGRGRGMRIVTALRVAIVAGGFDPRVFLDPPREVADTALPDATGIRAAIAIGGDGTLRAVAQRLFDRYAPGAIPPILIVPLGTANLMGQHLGLKWDFQNLSEQVMGALAARRVVAVDTARANGKLFLLMAGAGIDAHVVHELDRLRTGPIDLGSYALPAALALHGYNYAPIEVEIDGRRAFGPSPGMVFAGNVPEYGTGFPILPRARSDDGLLDVCVLPCKSRIDLLNLVMLIATGEHVSHADVLYTKARRVQVKSAGMPIPVQIDGEAAGHTPLDIEMLKVQISFIVAAKTKDR